MGKYVNGWLILTVVFMGGLYFVATFFLGRFSIPVFNGFVGILTTVGSWIYNLFPKVDGLPSFVQPYNTAWGPEGTILFLGIAILVCLIFGYVTAKKMHTGDG